MSSKIPSVAKTLGRNELHIVGLMHSALDIDDGGKIYDLIQALNSRDFLNPTINSQHEDKPYIEIHEPLSVADYSDS